MLIDGIVALVLMSVALATVGYVVRLVLSPMFGLIRIRLGEKRARHLQDSISKIDLLLSSQKYQQAIELLTKSVIYDRAHTPELVISMREYHQNILSRCLLVAEELNIKLSNIADVERLLLQQSELQTLLLRSEAALARFKERRKEKGKPTPEWGVEDYKNKISKIAIEISDNEKSLKVELQNLFAALGEKKTSDTTPMYH